MNRFQNVSPKEMLELEWLAEEFHLFEQAWQKVKVIEANKRKWNESRGKRMFS